MGSTINTRSITFTTTIIQLMRETDKVNVVHPTTNKHHDRQTTAAAATSKDITMIASTTAPSFLITYEH